MFEFPFKRQSAPKLEQETATIRVDAVKEKGFAVYLAACQQNREVAEVNGRQAMVTDCQIKGGSVLEVSLKYCDFQSIKRVAQ
ncbi:hypothetical protein ACXIVC_21715 [Vibrio parahaemolyticus]